MQSARDSVIVRPKSGPPKVRATCSSKTSIACRNPTVSGRRRPEPCAEGHCGLAVEVQMAAVSIGAQLPTVGAQLWPPRTRGRMEGAIAIAMQKPRIDTHKTRRGGCTLQMTAHLGGTRRWTFLGQFW